MTDDPTNTTPMDCMDIKALLSSLLDDELDAKSRHAAERHIASCDTCRALVDEADQLDGLVAESMAESTADSLPEGFEGSVLSRTVYDTPTVTYMHRWTTWVGWVAAAAALLLAMSVWIMDRRAGLVPTGDDEFARATAPAPRPTGITSAYSQRPLGSWVHPGDEPVEPANQTPGEPSEDAPWIAGEMNAVPIAQRQQTSADLHSLMARADLTPNDAQLLYASSLLLEQLAHADPDSFADVEAVRHIAEYDEILPRLAELRSRLSPTDRSTVFAAESILLRTVRGPVSQDDVQLMRQTIAQMNLAEKLDAIGITPQSRHSV